MQTRILRILLKKELTLMLRNPLIPRLIVAMPLLVMLVIPLVADLDVKDVGVAVVDVTTASCHAAWWRTWTPRHPSP